MYESLSEVLQDQTSVDLEFNCHDCQAPVRVRASRDQEAVILEPQDRAAGYYPETESGHNEYFTKCPACYQAKPELTNYRPVETYTRVVGYYRPVHAWNKGKKSEYQDRVMYSMPREGK